MRGEGLMNEEEILFLCEKLTSDDIVETKEARRQLKDALTPIRIYEALKQEKPKLSQLFSRAQISESIEVNQVVCEALSSLWQDKSLGPLSYEEDSDGMMIRYVMEAIVSESISISTMARKPFLDVLLISEKDSSTKQGYTISTALNHLIKGDKVLRLFDCDNIESESNVLVYQYIKNRSVVVQEIIRVTVSAFENDPLLLANVLVLYGILSRVDRELLNTPIASRVHETLVKPDDDTLTWIAVSQFCYCALWRCEAIATDFADEWIATAAMAISSSGASEEIVSLGIGVACAGCSTSTGWNATVKYFSCDIICALLRSRSAGKIVSALTLLSDVYQSPFCNTGGLNFRECISEAWNCRLSLEESVRLHLWIAILAMSRQVPFTLRDACISFLSTSTVHEVASVREKQLQVAELLLCTEELGLVPREGLQRFIRAGLHPPGSSGVAALPG